VRDTGEGVPADAIERIFEPFEQASAVPASRGGAGLGLTISRQLARAMGGDVTCRPAPGKGARFRFTMAYVPTDEVPVPRREPLPPRPPAPHAPAPAPAPSPSHRPRQPDFADTEPMTMTLAMTTPHLPAPATAAKAAARPPAVAPGPAPRRDSGVGGRVLIVEDNEVNALVVRGMLDWLGVQSERVTDGRLALDAMKAQGTSSTHPRFDLVLMDCQMPVLDGWSATREWRQLERERSRVRPGEGRAGTPGKRLPIVALTASAAAGERERCLEAGMDDYLSKPFTREQLLEAIRPWLSRAAPAPAPARPGA